jgi:hypothetical protein
MTRLCPGACFSHDPGLRLTSLRDALALEAWEWVRRRWDKAINLGDEDIAAPSHPMGGGCWDASPSGGILTLSPFGKDSGWRCPLRHWE